MGDSVWLHNVRRKRGRHAKLDNPWEGPFLVTAVLSDMVYRFQRTPKTKPKVVHVNRLKPYLGPPLKSWLLTEKKIETTSSTSLPTEAKSVKSDSSPTVYKCLDTTQPGDLKEQSKETEVSKINSSTDVVGLPSESDIEDAQEEEIEQEVSTADADNERRPVEGNIERKNTRPRKTIVAPKRFGDWVSSMHAMWNSRKTQ